MNLEEIKYARQDVRCTAALLNAAKQEFDLHPIPVSPDKAYSPASIAKGYLEAMNIQPPEEKFKVSLRTSESQWEVSWEADRKHASGSRKCRLCPWISLRNTRARAFCSDSGNSDGQEPVVSKCNTASEETHKQRHARPMFSPQAVARFAFLRARQT